MNDFSVFELEHNGVEYTAEFDFDALRLADSLGIMSLTDKTMAFVSTVLFCATRKHHPFSTRKKIDEFFDAVVQDPEYGIGAFDDIVEEFTNHFLQFISNSGKGEKKTKKFTARTVKVVNSPKAK